MGNVFRRKSRRTTRTTTRRATIVISESNEIFKEHHTPFTTLVKISTERSVPPDQFAPDVRIENIPRSFGTCAREEKNEDAYIFLNTTDHPLATAADRRYSFVPPPEDNLQFDTCAWYTDEYHEEFLGDF